MCRGVVVAQVRRGRVDRNTLFESLQGAFVSGALLVIGSGVSAGYGLPTMPQLAHTLIDEVPRRLVRANVDSGTWAVVSAALKAGAQLEVAMDTIENGDPIVSVIEEVTAEAVSARELEALKALASSRDSRGLPELLSYFGRTAAEPTVVTTNYDRLIEFACELENVAVDTGFLGKHLGRFSEEASRNEMLIPSRVRRGSVPSTSRKPHIRLAKPHGSLDWYLVDDAPRFSSAALGLERLMITPGQSKYLSAHKPPFDAHMQRAKDAIDIATSMVFVGYGFNDVHLQTHFPPRLAAGVPTVVMARSLTDSARDYLGKHPHILALERDDSAPEDTLVYQHGTVTRFSGDALWGIEQLMAEVLIP